MNLYLYALFNQERISIDEEDGIKMGWKVFALSIQKR